MDLAFHDSRFTAEISKRMQVTIYEILKGLFEVGTLDYKIL